ncbi:MAG: SDR family NAD(P)-dependent oxidoreductase [Acidimicrobiia bacterium]|nr:SDR family NAD(P)-dependent oxidoreductase [Acidimicrobiia bacterium]
MTLPAGSPFDLSGRVALITGGNGGIGLGMAEGLAAHGADIAIWGTNPDKNDAAIERLGRHDVELLSIVCDVGDEQAVVQAMSDTVDELGRIDAAFVNAGVGGRASSFVDMSDDEWRRVMRVNLDGAFYTCREATKHMAARRAGGDESGGSIVVTTSGSAYFGQQSGQHYGASKAGVISMMRAIAVQHARDGIRANAILPGWIESDMTESLFEYERFVDRVLPRVPMRRWGKADDFAGLAVYLASPASSYHTGDVITIDGGYHSF